MSPPWLLFRFSGTSGYGGIGASPDLACNSRQPTVEADDRHAITSLRLLAVLTVLTEYARARQAARASY